MDYNFVLHRGLCLLKSFFFFFLLATLEHCVIKKYSIVHM